MKIREQGNYFCEPHFVEVISTRYEARQGFVKVHFSVLDKRPDVATHYCDVCMDDGKTVTRAPFRVILEVGKD